MICFGMVLSLLASVLPFDVQHYSVALTLDIPHHTIKATETIRLHLADAAIREIDLNADELAIETVSAGKQKLQFSQSPGSLQIFLTGPLARRTTLTLSIAFHASPTKGLRFFDTQAYTVYSTSHWMVANHIPADLATIDLRVQTPAKLTVITNGKNRPLPDFVLGFAAGPFHQSAAKAGKTELRYFSSKYSSAQLAHIFQATPSALRFFASKAAVPYPSRTYSQVMVNGSPEQELGDFTLLPDSYGETLLTHPDDQWLLAHELAHQWWGIGLACRDWSDFWLNEGVASFMADAFLGEQFGPARYDHEIESARQAYEALKTTGKDHPLCYRGKAESEVGGRLPYAKGAWVLHLLKQQMGDQAFWSGFQEYTRAHWGRTVTSEDFQSAMQHAAKTDLSPFFNQWVYH